MLEPPGGEHPRRLLAAGLKAVKVPSRTESFLHAQSVSGQSTISGPFGYSILRDSNSGFTCVSRQKVGRDRHDFDKDGRCVFCGIAAEQFYAESRESLHQFIDSLDNDGLTNFPSYIQRFLDDELRRLKGE
jgi:hypothetical protein